MTHYKFVSWDIPAFETILTGRIPAAMFRLVYSFCGIYAPLLGENKILWHY
jgi:hypothetical protein